MVVALGVVLAATRAGFCTVDSMAFLLLRFNYVSRLAGSGRPTGALHAELLSIFGGQSLPALELHGVARHDASDRLTREQPIQHVEADVPARGAPRDVAAIDVVPEREARAAAQR